MAIYSCNLKSIGPTTHAPGTAGAHIRYIARPDAQPVLLSEHMPYEHREARSWMDGRERALRKNARVIDKIRIALPKELSAEQRAELVETFMADLTGGRVPWFAAIHQHGRDAHNPHVHIAVHDRDFETGKRVLRLSDSARDRARAGLPGPKAVEWIRERWEAVCNDALTRAGIEARIDRRTLVAQGIERQPSIHEGPRAQHIDTFVKRPESRRRVNGCGRVIDYPSIDHGKTRREFNAHIIDLNLERAARSKNAVTAVWAQFEKEQTAADRALEDRLAQEERKRTAALRKASGEYRERTAALRDQRRKELRNALTDVRRRFLPEREALRKKQAGERAALKDKQSRLLARILRVIDLTGGTRRRQEQARKALSAEHKRERAELSRRYHAAQARSGKLIKAQHRAARDTLGRERRTHIAELKQRYAAAQERAEAQRQQREIEREHARQLAQGKIDTWRRTRKDAGPLGKESGFADEARCREGVARARRTRSRPQPGPRHRPRAVTTAACVHWLLRALA